MKKYKLFLLGLIVMGALLGSFHHHDDGLSSNNCLSCLVQQHLDVSGDLDNYTLSEIDAQINIPVLHNYTYHVVHVNPNFLSRAPPSFS